MNYWFVFLGENNEYIRQCFGTDYLIIKSKQKRCTQKFLNDIANMLGIQAISKSEVCLLDVYFENKNSGRTYIKGNGIQMEVPSHNISYTILEA